MILTTMIHAMIVMMMMDTKNEEEDTPEDGNRIDMICLNCRAIYDLFPVFLCATSCPNMYDNISQIHVYKPTTCLVQTPSFTDISSSKLPNLELHEGLINKDDWMTTMNLANCYFHVQLHEKDHDKVAFAFPKSASKDETEYNYYVIKILVYGLKPALRE